MIESQEKYLASQKISLRICGLCNTKKMIVREDGLTISNWKALMDESEEKASLPDFVKNIFSRNMENSVFIDVTASDEPVKYYNTVLSGNVAIVTANKRANTQSMEQYRLLHNSASARNTPFHYETNVGAGLPVINVLQSLEAGSDEVVKIEAVLSGTLNYLLSEYNGDKSFSDLVMYAKENNYSEPDPRDDLSGMDVARKCLILARECGWEMELEDIKVESLMSEAAAKAKDVPTFFKELKDYDKVFHKRFEEAKAKKKRIRYVANIESGKAKISVMEVDETHSFYSLRGTENCISLTSKYYQQYPMVIKGPGAGVNVTAAGVFAEIISISKYFE